MTLEPLAVRPSEQILLDALDEMHGRELLCTSLGRAQAAAAAAASRPGKRVTCWFLDLYQADQARAHHHDGPANLTILCQPDLPVTELDSVAIPITAGGDAELTREIMQEGHQALRIGGRMLAATDNPRDTWLGGEMRKLFDRVTRRPKDRGALYLATKTRPLAKLKNFTCEFVFRDRQRLIRAVSRPGVFAHRRVDPGARALMEVMEIEPGARVLDMGCGSGTVALAAAVRAPGVSVHGIDSNPRAVECLLRGAALNDLSNLTGRLDAEGAVPEPGRFDLVLANPPYYSNFRIAEIFLAAGRRALRPGGKLLLVTKMPDWYLRTLPQRFDQVQARKARDYIVVEAVQRSEPDESS